MDHCDSCPFDPPLAQTLQLAKAWAQACDATEVELHHFLEAAHRLHATAVEAVLTGREGVAEAHLANLAREAWLRPIEPGSDRQPLHACLPLAAAVGSLGAGEPARRVELSEVLARLAERGDLDWVTERYAPLRAHAPLERTMELVDLLGQDHALRERAAASLLKGGRVVEDLLRELETSRVEVDGRWRATPRRAPVRELYAGWELDAPLTARSAAVDAVLVRALRPRAGTPPLTPQHLTWLVGLEAYPCDLQPTLDGLDHAAARGLVRRMPCAPGELSIVDPLIATQDLLRDVAGADAHDVLPPAWRERMRRWLDSL